MEFSAQAKKDPKHKILKTYATVKVVDFFIDPTTTTTTTTTTATTAKRSEQSGVKRGCLFSDRWEQKDWNKNGEKVTPCFSIKWQVSCFYH